MTTLMPTVREATWNERASTLAMFLTLGLAVGTWAAALPGLKSELGLSDRDLSFALLALAIGSVGSTIATGIIAPRFGTGRSTGVSALAMVVAFALPAFASSYVQLLISALLMGITTGALDISVNGHASDVERRWTSPIMSSFHAAFSLGGLVGAAFGGFLAGAGWQVAGQIFGPLLLAALVAVAAMPWLGSGARHTDKPEITFAMPERSMLGLCAVVLFCFLIEGAMADWSAVYLATVTQSSPAIAATGYAAFSIAMATGRVVGDGIVTALGPKRVVLFGGLLAATGMGLAVAFPDPLVAAIGFALVGAGAANIVPVVFSAAGRYGSSPSAGVAMVATVGYAGFLGGPPIIGFVASVGGLRLALGLLVVAAVLVAVGGLGLDRGGKAASS
ncbi:MFS transporter [Lichenihabitans psoromatis]|uniref:MFS transporter n=1 Tax=Lichenihabitans psoromatis TaxID=2528642 RepID=UPI00103837E9|nr:MFS transporter [Lichenihabitans psoromatis]